MLPTPVSFLDGETNERNEAEQLYRERRLEFDGSCNGLIGISITVFIPSGGFETNRFADTLCLLAKRLQLRLYEFGLNSNDVIEILSVNLVFERIHT